MLRILVCSFQLTSLDLSCIQARRLQCASHLGLHQLIEFVDDISKNIQEGQQTDILILDFAKAFDKVNHSLLIHKLQHYGIIGVRECLCHGWPRICSVCRNHNMVLSLFITYHNLCNKSIFIPIQWYKYLILHVQNIFWDSHILQYSSSNSWMTSPRTYKKANKQISSYWTLLRLLTSQP
jgi:hypothetical protein